ncbi:MAG: DNA polymerase III subunit delta' [Bacteroidales bacterium]|nr:DNA polymerase III subunit delta' [Bacteroidales bacterium]
MIFSEVIGQKHILERLRYIAQHEKIPHALLFTGSEGSGKLATALAFAQYINCLQPKEHDSCNQCSSCHKFSHLIHPDLHFVFPIYKGSRTSAVCDDFIQEWRDFVLLSPYFNSSDWYDVVAEDKGQPTIYADEAHEIIRKISIKNYEAKYKIIIIYQPERMHIATANKLLKVLEEPPPSTVFILISAQPELLLSTIVSRCQVIKFPTVDDVSLSEFLEKKYPQASTQDIHQSVILSGGNVPQAIRLLEKHESTRHYFTYFVQMVRMAYEINRKKPKTEEQIKWVQEVIQFSKEEQKEFLIYCLRFIRDNFLINLNVRSIIFQSKEEQEFSQKFSPFMPFSTAYPIFQHISKAIYHLERNGNPRIVFTDLIYKISLHF